MTRIAPVTAENTDARTEATLGAVKSKLGMVPNLIATLARSPVALDSYLQLSETLAGGRLNARQRELIALTVAQENGCEYCLRAHAAIGKGAGLNAHDIDQARHGHAEDPFENALSEFALAVVKARGGVDDDALDAVRQAGADDGLVVEIVANVTLHVLTNYVNRLAGTEVDFPPLPLPRAA